MAADLPAPKRSAHAGPMPPLGHLGRYELLHAIGSGGMATVYLARAAGIGGFERVVAIKCCHPHLRRDDQFAAMFLDEARLAARIHHQNVVATLDVGEETALYFVMEYVEGVSLAEWVKAVPGGLPVGVALRVMADVLAGLHAAHELRDGGGRPMELVHRDVSPQNVLVGTDGIARIVDFGVAKASARATVTRGGEIKGKLGYMPPEQFLGQPVTRRADIYAAGVVLWEALAGRRLFAADSDARIMNLVLHGKIPRLSEVLPAVPAQLDDVLAKALQRRAEDRYATAAEFAEALEGAGASVASAREVGGQVQAVFADWLAQRRSLLASVGTSLTRAPAEPHEVVREAPTFLQRLLDGNVLIIPRRAAMMGMVGLALAAAAVAFALWQRAPGPVAVPAPAVAPLTPARPLPPEVETAPAVLPQASSPLADARPKTKPVEVPEAKSEAGARPKRASRAAARPRPRPAPARKTEGSRALPDEFRPTEL